MGAHRQKGTWDPNASLAGLIRKASFVLEKRVRKELSRNALAHLSLGRIGVLSVLLESPRTQAWLSKHLQQKPPSMFEMLKRLEKESLVQAESNKDDQRKIDWMLTYKGKREITKAKRILQGMGQRTDAFFRRNKISARDIDRTKEILALWINHEE